MPRGVQKRHVYLSNALQLRLQLAQQEQPQQVQQHAQLQTQLEQLLQPKPKPKPKKQPTQEQPQQKQKQQQEAAQQKPQQQDDQDVQRVCLNEYCKSPFESPQWRRGPLGPGTLCNACGTRYARMEAKKKGARQVRCGGGHNALHLVLVLLALQLASRLAHAKVSARVLQLAPASRGGYLFCT
jgi:hypothetical protein